MWRKIAFFYVLTLLFSNVFNAFTLFAGTMDAGNLLYVTGAMWSPGLAALATKRIFNEPIASLPWRWGGARNAWLAYLIPLGYALPVYLAAWFTPLGAFLDRETFQRTAAQFGWANFPPALSLFLFVVLTATTGLVGKTSRALGEEIGWRGFLVPELNKVVGFWGVGLISGLMWAVYHFPVLLFADYNKGAPAWYSLVCFTLMVVADSFILAWLTLRSNSLWPAAIFHGSHNLFIQSIFTPLTRETGPTKYIIDEFGIGLVITVTVAAVIFCRKNSGGPSSEPTQEQAGSS
ncbi:MAG TPA: type II CAAX endopeptidase family protein [Chthoniobacterales bacterium]|nr:type II CAAX endopeptidase family protein [Chthoniobacterales bacterium]